MTGNVRYEDNDGSIADCILIAHGPRFDAYVFYDLVAVQFGADADVMRGCLKDGAKTVSVEFPGEVEHRQYVNLAAAKRAVERHAAR